VMGILAGRLAGFGQGLDEVVPVWVTRVNVVATVAPARDVIQGTGRFSASFAGHADDALPVGEGGQTKNERYYVVPPFQDEF